MLKGDMAQQLNEILTEARQEIVEITETSMRAIAKETSQRIKTDASIKRGLHRSGDYARGWTMKQQKKRGEIVGFVVYNRTKPGLTHLLEKGHVIRNKYGEYGRTNGIPHISTAERWSQVEIMRQLGNRLGQMK